MTGLLGSPFARLGGLRIVESEMLGDAYEDWSQVRSPGRAARRRRLGHPQRIVTRYRANGKVLEHRPSSTLYMHPDDARALERKLRDDLRRTSDAAFLAYLAR